MHGILPIRLSSGYFMQAKHPHRGSPLFQLHRSLVRNSWHPHPSADITPLRESTFSSTSLITLLTMASSSSDIENPPSYLSSWRLSIVIGSLCLGIFLLGLDMNIIGVAIPKITSDFKSLEDIAWYGSAYLLAITAFQPSFGNLYKYFDVKLVYLSSIAIFEGLYDSIARSYIQKLMVAT